MFLFLGKDGNQAVSQLSVKAEWTAGEYVREGDGSWGVVSSPVKEACCTVVR